MSTSGTGPSEAEAGGTRAGGARTWRYRFSWPREHELETAELASDAAATARARELSTAGQTPVTIERHDLVDWEYIGEVDERP